MPELSLKVLDGDYSIHQLDPDSDVPALVFSGEFSFVAHTDDELSVVCPSDIPLKSSKVEPGWSCWRVIVKSGVWPFDSSGDLVDFCYLDSIFEFNSRDHFGQVIKPA